MNRPEIRQLRGQMAMIFGLMLVCIVAATVVSAKREFAAKFIVEKYQPLPVNLQSDVALLKKELRVTDEFADLPANERVLVYDYWMILEEPEVGWPKVLLDVDFELFNRRAERTLVCGSSEQRIRALRFLQLAANHKALATLEKAAGWARRRQLSDFAKQIDETIQQIEQQIKPENQDEVDGD